jgi:hypothetical protein
MTALAVGLPVEDKFQLYVYENRGLALDMVTQLRGIPPQSVGYLSKELDQTAKGCNRLSGSGSNLLKVRFLHSCGTK